MRCVKPFVGLHGAFGCGQCLPCRVQKRRTWTHRILLEAIDAGSVGCSFATLTYAEDKKDLAPGDLQLWLKRFRKRVSPSKIRFFACGEYGDISWRPHYHVALFGHPHCLGDFRVNGECRCSPCVAVRETWGYGHVMLGRLETQSAAYIAGYVVKKMTMWDDPRLQGRHPEFSRMSLRPGIGALAMHNVASEMMRYSLEKRADVPAALRFGGKLMPIGKYLRGKLREAVGRDKKAPEISVQFGAERLRLVREYAFANDRSVASVFEEINAPFEGVLKGREQLLHREHRI